MVAPPKRLTTAPGVYKMLGANGKLLYVGKAKNLKRRVASYFRAQPASAKIAVLMQQVHAVEVVITQTENEALLLESNLIKTLKPRYNVVFRDDKSYPYLYLSSQQTFPRLSYHRGAKRAKGQYFGPYPSASAVHDTLAFLQKLFRIRQCSDSFFSHRSRPCLQYQIRRCTAPCVGYIEADAYQQDVRHIVLFLAGKSTKVIKELSREMAEASAAQNYEQAALLRDKIVSLQKIQARQYITHKSGDTDVISVVCREQKACIVVLYIRAGQLIGDKHYIVDTAAGISGEDVLADFLPQYYLRATHKQAVPRSVLVNVKLSDKAWIAGAISQEVGHKLRIVDTHRGKEREWLRMASQNADYKLSTQLADEADVHQRFVALQQALQLPALPEWVECFDVSHTFGSLTVAAAVVFSTSGAEKNYYRRFNLSDITPGDDYAALKQTLERHYRRAKEKEAKLPDLIIIDGGKGQLSAAKKALEEIQLVGVTLIAVSKGPKRKAGEELLHRIGLSEPLRLSPDSPALHLIQFIRDEAHRFAITGHRNRRAKVQTVSVLDTIPGVGAVRRRNLLHHFGGLRAIEHASVASLAGVSGISAALAQKIYDALHDS